MPKATEHHTTSRRALFSAAAALPLAALPIVALAAENPDAELLRLYRAALRQNAEVEAIAEEGHYLPPGITSASRDQEARLAAALDVEADLFEEIISTPARTPNGRRAKADCLRIGFTRCICDGVHPTIATIDDDGEWHERLAWSLARDVLAEGSV